MKNLAHELKPLFVEAVAKAFPELSEAELVEIISVEEPREAGHGDFACPVAFRLAKMLGKNPVEIGNAIVENFPEDYRIGDVEFLLPGFVNVRVKVSYLEEVLKQLETGFSYEGGPARKRPVIVEYPSTNAAKQMGVHHIITTFLGDALANLFDFMGYEVMRINHLGDWGTHFGKLIYAIETWGDKAVIHADPNMEFNKLYVKFNDEAEKNPELLDEARAIFKSLEEGDELRLAMWNWIVKESTEDLEKLLARLGVEVDMHMGESFYLKMMEPIVEEGIKRGLFVEGEGGSLIYDMGEDQTPALIKKSDGTTLYLTRDIATIKYRVETWNPATILYVVDHAQSLHFKQNFEIARALGTADDTDLEHVAFGRMRFADGSMSTRKGTDIKLPVLLNEAAKRAAALAAERGTELPREEFAAMAELIGKSSVKYGVLNQDRVKDIIFEWEKVITLEGNSAPYLLYSYARAHNIVVKAGDVPLSGLPKLTEEAEIELVRHMLKFPNALERAVNERKPHMVSFYLYELCQEFNRFYGKVRVMEAEEDAKRSRLMLVHAFMHQLKAGLSILGIPVVERM
ncbi:arginine--tRNA ligase [Candidatus Peregrinibacteria bacterium]|jgi:arginyl-tRNA synthetase|nr:arginine--tRNA ligase [Candidatus Peregrinibacteria bacterium]MBT4632358.1 arginine--tRNA ligase [Candidatus Peregrinibacteria bacterium]